ncbi:hypothetical protein C5C31_03320 [Rathayibacter rathayi]|uniref:RES domain-containing protein n=1 Tax=Rathayibacter rathayi TaxID=33887 RepID=A0ABD6W705_RATRA|nr:RES domain-containing protein [Rathayibacter rathayi]AZZ47834.1 hypothetical protein C1O28_00320 [Rathayibacter rathayi]MWV75086.1 RES domain-containing protein [Rathayibacter rathayi NCPPB 2980 = VKM Ac-1601]PPF11993.1 hypothetical protein C5C04_11280 [Rathayibacter rathayi]PPF51375.1 hypothetical protein C5C08_03080 [Rathayibacter rathayi]PPF76805.1 hypothetical protein C5C14_13170 [Rathayibacter rathayi]
MLVYRVFAHDPEAEPGASGHPDHVYSPAQGFSRLDNPASYTTWYFGQTPEVAVGESFGDLAVWSEDMFETPWLRTGRRVLGVFDIPDDTPLLDLDDARSLLDRSLRPTQVVTRVRAVSQAWALSVFQEQRHGRRCWDGVRWWSYQRPHWAVLGLWHEPTSPPRSRFVEAQRLSREHPAVVSARASLQKAWH